MKLETTDHCDVCGRPLGTKCDRNIHGFTRAMVCGLYVRETPSLMKKDYRFYCSMECLQTDEGHK